MLPITTTMLTGDRIRRVRRAFVVTMNRPAESLERAVEQAAAWRDRRRGERHYHPTEAWREELARLLGDRPADDPVFHEVWHRAVSDVRARGLEVGRGVFGGWDDADVRLGQLAWWLTRLLRPEFVVETGVARGLSTRIILEAIARNGAGRLWSIDRRPLMNELTTETAAAVPTSLHDRWTLLSGTSRQRLPPLLRQLPRVDLFVHDSMHTTRNVSFELDSIWPSLRSGGVALVDDVQRNRATGLFLQSHPRADGMVCRAADGQALIGVLAKRSD